MKTINEKLPKSVIKLTDLGWSLLLVHLTHTVDHLTLRLLLDVVIMYE